MEVDLYLEIPMYMHDWFAELLKPIYVVLGHGNAKNCTKSPPIPSLLSLIKFNKVQSIVCATFPGYEWLWHVLNASPGWENGTKPGVPCHSSFLPRTRHKGLQGSFFRSTRPPLVTSNNSRAFNFYVLRHPAPLHPFHPSQSHCDISPFCIDSHIWLPRQQPASVAMRDAAYPPTHVYVKRRVWVRDSSGWLLN